MGELFKDYVVRKILNTIEEENVFSVTVLGSTYFVRATTINEVYDYVYKTQGSEILNNLIHKLGATTCREIITKNGLLNNASSLGILRVRAIVPQNIIHIASQTKV